MFYGTKEKPRSSKPLLKIRADHPGQGPQGFGIPHCIAFPDPFQDPFFRELCQGIEEVPVGDSQVICRQGMLFPVDPLIFRQEDKDRQAVQQGKGLVLGVGGDVPEVFLAEDQTELPQKEGILKKPLSVGRDGQGKAQAAVDTQLASDGDVTLVPVGPLTNIAVAMRMEPGIIPKIREIVLMGGAYGTGNVTPSAEFNIYADPEAARVVFTSGVPITMMGLDLTNQTACTMDVIERMERTATRAGKLFGEIMRFTYRTQHEAYGLDGGPVHDATCIAYLIDPDSIRTKDMYVEIDVNEGPCYGRTVCDELGVLKKKANAKVGTGIDCGRF